MVMNRSDFVFIDLWAPLSLYYMIVAALALTALLLCVLVHSRFGVTLRALKSNQSRVEAMGLNALRFRITAYMISAMICGLAGALFANWQEYVSPDIMHWTRSGELMIVIVLGGSGDFGRPVAGRGGVFPAGGIPAGNSGPYPALPMRRIGCWSLACS